MHAVDPAYAHFILLCIVGVIGISIVAAAISFMVVGRAAFAANDPSATATFGLLFQTLPTVLTITLIIIATSILTSFGYIESNGCIAIFSSVASFVLGAETQKRKSGSDSLTPNLVGGIAGTPPIR